MTLAALLSLVSAMLAPTSPCPTSVEVAIRANPRFANLARPMRCNFVEITKAGAAGWGFRHGGKHWYVGQAHIYRKVCGPARYACYGARVVAFAGHRS